MKRAAVLLGGISVLVVSCSRSPGPRRDVEPHVVLEFRLVDDSGDRPSPFTIIVHRKGPRMPERVYTDLPEAETIKMRRHGREGGRFREELHVHKTADLQLHNTDIKRAEAQFGRRGFEVFVNLTESGSRKLAGFTRDNIGRKIAIMFEGEVYSAPIVASEISGSIVLSGYITEKEAARIAAVLSGRPEEADSEKWLPGKPNIVWGVILATIRHILPYLLIACGVALLLTRLRWLAALGAALASAVLYTFGKGVWWHLTLPSEAEFVRNLEDPAGRVFALANLFNETALPHALPWRDVMFGALLEMIPALAGGVLGIGAAWLLLRSERVKASLSELRDRIKGVFRSS